MDLQDHIIAALFFEVAALQAESGGAAGKFWRRKRQDDNHTGRCVPEHGQQPFSLLVTAASPMPFHKATAGVGVQHCP